MNDFSGVEIDGTFALSMIYFFLLDSANKHAHLNKEKGKQTELMMSAMKQFLCCGNIRHVVKTWNILSCIWKRNNNNSNKGSFQGFNVCGKNSPESM